MASSVDRFSRYAQTGYKVRCCLASCMARWISKPMIALPTGSWSARGRRLPGETGGFRGLGMRNNHPCLQLAGMIGGEKDHHSPESGMYEWCKKFCMLAPNNPWSKRAGCGSSARNQAQGFLQLVHSERNSWWSVKFQVHARGAMPCICNKFVHNCSTLQWCCHVTCMITELDLLAWLFGGKVY